MSCRTFLTTLFILFCLVPGNSANSWATDPGDECWSTDYYQAGVSGHLISMFSQPGAVYVGGYFSSITDVTVPNVARLEMSGGVITQVVPLGEGLDSAVKAFCEHDGDIIAAGNFSNSGATVLNHVGRWDGSAWHPLGDGLAEVWPQSLASYQGQIYSGNHRYDGVAWEEIFQTNGGITTLIVYDGLLYVGGTFTEAQGQPLINVFAWDGTQALAVGEGLPVPVKSATVGAAGVVFAGTQDFGYGQVTSWDGTAWTVELANTIAYEVAYLGDDLVVSAMIYLGGSSFTPRLLIDQGGSWHGLGDFDTGPLLEHEGLLLAKVKAGVEPGILSPGLIGFSGASFQSVFPAANGFDGSFAALARFGGSLMVGGDYSIANGEEFDGSAITSNGYWSRWGNSSDLNISFPGSFDDLAVVGSEVFGIYEFVDYDVAVSVLVKLVMEADTWQWQIFDPGNWFYGSLHTVGLELFNVGYGGVSQIDLQTGLATQVPGTDLNGTVYDACDYLGTITIGGSFTTNNGLPVSNVMRYVGGSWQNIGDPLPGTRVTAVAPMEGVELAAATLIDGVGRVSIFDGTSWSTLPGDFGNTVSDLVFHGGRLFAAGSFDNVGTVQAKGIALWTGERWAPLGSGLAGLSYSRISGMISVGDQLYLAGAFTWSGGQPCVGFAQWTGDPTLFTGVATGVSEEIMPPARLLGDVYPNPFNPNTRVAFIAPGDGNIKIGIFDLRGNQVRELVNEFFTAGSYWRTWNGLDDSGQALPSGMYFARMMTGNRVESVKLTLVR